MRPWQWQWDIECEICIGEDSDTKQPIYGWSHLETWFTEEEAFKALAEYRTGDGDFRCMKRYLGG
jgi:hypothetical protein